MKTFTFNDLVFQIFVFVILVILAGYLTDSMGTFQLPFDCGLAIGWLREAFYTLVILPLLHLMQ